MNYGMHLEDSLLEKISLRCFYENLSSLTPSHPLLLWWRIRKPT